MTLHLLLFLFFSLFNVCPAESEPPSEESVSGAFTDSDLAGKRVFLGLGVAQIQTRIIGGVDAWAHSWPWQVSLRFLSRPACGGAIVSRLWVISAAHCFRRYKKASLWTVLAGKHDLDDPMESGQQVVGVARIVPHEGYSPRTKVCDVALLRLDRPLDFSDSVRPIHVWTHQLPLRSQCTTTGWGSTRENGPRVNRLQEVNVTIVPSDVCNKYYRGRIRDSMFCAGKEGGGADACQGDSGGPMSCFTGRSYELAGLVSWGVGCGRPRRPGVYTKTQTFVPWIKDVITKENITETETPPEEEETCGRPRGSCLKAPLAASLSESQDGPVSVLNVTESCPYHWSWQVSVQRKGRHFCSGTLIQKHFVLTARHCRVRPEDSVVLEMHDFQIRYSSQRIPVVEVLDLPPDGDFPPGSDLSLLRLGACPEGTNVVPVCVPDEEDDDDLDPSWSCVVTGWGATPHTGPYCSGNSVGSGTERSKRLIK